MKLISDAFKTSHVILDLEATDITSALQQSVSEMASRGVIDPQIEDQVVSALLKREKEMPTTIGNSTAIPHAYFDGVDKQIAMFVRLAQPIKMGAPDGGFTQFLFLLLGPPDSAALHLDSLAIIARLTSDDDVRYKLGNGGSSDELLEAFNYFLIRTSPKGREEEKKSESLIYTGRLCGGLKQDIARRKPHYLSDFRDGIHTKCAGSILFLFFACLAPAVTFGSVMAVQTGGEIGVVEMILASAVCGIIYALFAGQPLIILGGTGPLLVFTVILYRLCADLSIPFLASYAWVGLWSAGFILLMAITDTSCLMKYFTRFTDEIFSALISIIFIYEAIKSLVYIFEDLDVKKHHDTALLSLLLALGTYYIAMSLSRFRRSKYLRPKMREFLADFGPTIALASMTLFAVWLHEVYLDMLPAPDTFGTTSGRPWAIDLMAAPVWTRYAAAGPALLVAILIYLDQNITSRVVNSPDHRLRKGDAYHQDLAVVGVLVGACSLFGLPWLVAATVRSLNHVRSLATLKEETDITGETRERVTFVRENRVTGLTIHILIGFSLLLFPLLKSIPMAIMYGLFLFMGVVSMSGNQFFERLSLWVRDPSLYPITHYIRQVPRWTIHAFTLLQLICLAILWFVKSSALGILFPIFIALLVPTRIIAGRYFSAE
ncbi:PTS sugar transporter subunit IIA [uncultured Gimesia sp.]|uniref:PTS sugar transporter subunit IIA n=1 Tax=uncultured Gimesia sp. TaxID=1678688 RepID=UPI00261EB43F|nr:PTS sugar transporter subunit IIA [uncultured Gimesia sp.]